MCRFLLFSLFFFPTLSCAQPKMESRDISISCTDGRVIPVKVELARTEQEREYGFMNRKNIPDGTGMIFIFERDQVLRFWMKNTPTALSIAYIDSTGRIRNIYDMTPFSLEGISSTVSVRYALEVPQGWFDRQKITAGDIVDLPALKK